MIRPSTRPRGADRLVGWMLLTALLAASALGWRAYRADQLRREAEDEVRTEAATFAAEIYAGALNVAFQSALLDAFAQGPELFRLLHEEGMGGPRAVVRAASVPAAFEADVASGELAVQGELPTGAEEWLRGPMLEHARTVYPAPAPYAVLTGGPGAGHRALVYRLESAPGGRTVARGFLLDLEALAPVYASLVGRARVLGGWPAAPPFPGDAVRVEVSTASGAPLWASRPLDAGDARGARVQAARAARVGVSVALASTVPAGQLPGAGSGEGFVALGLLAVAATLILASLALLRRERRVLAMREDFLSNVSHEMRTPLTQIRLFADSLLLGRLPGADAASSLRVIDREVTRLEHMVENVLTLSRLESARGRVRLPVELPDLLSRVVDAFAPLVEARDVVLSVDFSGRSCAVTDAEAVRRILVNLLDNALKYGPEGQEVSVEVVSEEEHLVIAVEDGGPGIPERDRDAVFERFERRSPPGGAPGTGLGLAVVADLAREAGGTVRVGDGAGGGARFTCVLPVAPCPDEGRAG